MSILIGFLKSRDQTNINLSFITGIVSYPFGITGKLLDTIGDLPGWYLELEKISFDYSQTLSSIHVTSVTCVAANRLEILNSSSAYV